MVSGKQFKQKPETRCHSKNQPPIHLSHWDRLVYDADSNHRQPGTHASIAGLGSEVIYKIAKLATHRFSTWALSYVLFAQVFFQHMGVQMTRKEAIAYQQTIGANAECLLAAKPFVHHRIKMVSTKDGDFWILCTCGTMWQPNQKDLDEAVRLWDARLTDTSIFETPEQSQRPSSADTHHS